MIFYEITITLFNKKDIYLNEIGSMQGKLIKNVMKKSKELSELHLKEGVKLYCFDYLYPRAENKIFEKNRVYYFKLRTPVEAVGKAFAKALNDFENKEFKLIARQIKRKKYYPKKQLYTSTPAICTLGDKYWKFEDGITLLEEKIEKNLVTKYIALNGTEPQNTVGFIQYLELKNQKPFTIKYKNGSLIGNKLMVEFASDELSQKMEFIAYTTSILEKSSSLGSGFCI